MQITKQTPAFVILLAVLANSHAELAVYTWVDGNGVTCFSDTPPADESISAKLVAGLPPPATGTPGEGDFYSILNQAQRMETQRLLAEKLKAERLRAEAEANRARADSVTAQQPDIVYDYEPGGYLLPYYPRHHHRHPHKDHKPVPPENPKHYTRSSIIQPPPLSEALRLSPDAR